MLPGFQKYLVDKGFKRTYSDIKGEQVEDYSSLFVSAYNPLFYEFRKDNHYCYWGLCEMGKPPVMNLGKHKMFLIQNESNFRTYEDGYRILFSKWHEEKFNEIYDAFINGKSFIINCQDEKNITITLN